MLTYQITAAVPFFSSTIAQLNRRRGTRIIWPPKCGLADAEGVGPLSLWWGGRREVAFGNNDDPHEVTRRCFRDVNPHFVARNSVSAQGQRLSVAR